MRVWPVFGKIACLLVLCNWCLFWSPPDALSDPLTYTVTNTSGSSSVRGSLPWALHQANLTSTPAVIRFDLQPDSEVQHRIVLEDRLWINETVTIDGTSQPGYTDHPLIQIDVNGHVNAFTVLNTDQFGEGGSDSEILGLQIFGFTQNAIATQPEADNVTIAYNHIGFYWDFEKQKWWRNFEANLTQWEIEHTNTPVYGDYVQAIGIGLQSSHNKVFHNVISGVHNGISIGYDFENQNQENWGPECVGNQISNNLIGTTPDGNSILTNTEGAKEYRPDPAADPFGSPAVWRYFGNNSDGIYLAALVKETLITNNTVSGNYSVGIELLHETVTDNTIAGNTVGLNSVGNSALPNGELGIILSNGAHHNVVGGQHGANIVSGNSYAGIELGGEYSFQRSSYNTVSGNLIGCDATASYAIGHQTTGIHLGTSQASSNVLIGNTVVGNEWGIYLEGATSNCIAGNFIGSTLSGNNIGNQKSGIVLDQADQNTLVDNTIQYNGHATSGHEDWFFAIWERSSSGTLCYDNTIKENKTGSNVLEQALPGCLYIDPVLGLYLPCVDYQGLRFRLYLSYSQPIQNSQHLLWQLNESLLLLISCDQTACPCCLDMSEALSLDVTNTMYQGYALNLQLDFDPDLSGADGLFWGLSLQ
jgi:parallel beta-helix repeat protein